MAPSSGRPTLGGRVQRDVRLQAALALLVGIAVVAVPLFVVWNRNKHGDAAAPTPSVAVEDAGPVVVNFGDAGPSLTIDAGGRSVVFGEPRYLKCQDPGPSKTPPERCDHLGAIEEVATRAIVERAVTCLPAASSSQTVAFIVDVSFKRRRVRLHDGRDGSTMPAAARKKLVSCIEKALVPPNWDTVAHAHQRYVFQFLTTFSAPPAAANAGATAAALPVPVPLGPP